MALSRYPWVCSSPLINRFRNVRLDYRLLPKGQLFGERLKPVDAPRAKNKLCAEPSQVPRRGFSESAAGTSDDDHLVFDILGHFFSCFCASSLSGSDHARDVR